MSTTAADEEVDEAILQLEEEITSNLQKETDANDATDDENKTQPNKRGRKRKVPDPNGSRSKFRTQKYRPSWEMEEAFEGWLTSVASDETSAFCRFCNCILRAHKKALDHHAATSKHIKNAQKWDCKSLQGPGSPMNELPLEVSVTSGSQPLPSLSSSGCFSPTMENRLHSSLFHPLLRTWHSSNSTLTPSNLMYPVFVVEDPNAIQPVPNMPGIFRYGVNKLVEALGPLVQKGLSAILLFGVIEGITKDARGSGADLVQNPVITVVKKLRNVFQDLILACDVCLCAYTDHGHCAILSTDGTIDNKASIRRITQIATAYARAGCHIVAPSDMLDGSVGAIKRGLHNLGYGARVSVLSYAANFATAFCGPFKDAGRRYPAYIDRQCYQIPTGSLGIAMRAADRDISEGADMLVVKPGVSYLDVIMRIKKQHKHYTMLGYHVEGDYAMLHQASQTGILDLKSAVIEQLTSMRRAGADVIITYFTPKLLDWLAGSVQQVFVVVGQRTSGSRNGEEILYLEQ